MSFERFLSGQRRGVNRVLAMFVGLLTLMWVATLLDYIFNLGWGWDTQILWLAPPMVLLAAFLRFCVMAIFKFVESNY